MEIKIYDERTMSIRFPKKNRLKLLIKPPRAEPLLTRLYRPAQRYPMAEPGCL